MSIYMKIASIPGNVTTKGFEKSSHVFSMDHSSERSVDQRIGTSNQDVGSLKVDHLNLQKPTDAASAQLWQTFYSGKYIPSVEIFKAPAGGGTWQSKITLSNVLITSMQEQGSEHSSNELLTLAFSKIERSYQDQNTAGQQQAQKHTSFDLATAEVG